MRHSCHLIGFKPNEPKHIPNSGWLSPGIELNNRSILALENEISTVQKKFTRSAPLFETNLY